MFANNSLGVGQKNVSFIIAEQTSSSSSSSSSGGGSSKKFLINSSILEIAFFPGENQFEKIKIENLEYSRIKVKLETKNLEDFFQGENEIILNSREKKDLFFNFSADSKQEPGIYLGEIIFSTKDTTKKVSCVVEVKEKEPLLDVTLEIFPEYKNVVPGQSMKGIVGLMNIANKEKVDVELKISILDLEENVIYDSKKENLEFESNISLIKNFQIPEKMKKGFYIILSEIKYQESFAKAYDIFEVKERKPVPFFYTKELALFFCLLTLFLSIALLVFILLKRPFKKTEFP